MRRLKDLNPGPGISPAYRLRFRAANQTQVSTKTGRAELVLHFGTIQYYTGRFIDPVLRFRNRENPAKQALFSAP